MSAIDYGQFPPQRPIIEFTLDPDSFERILGGLTTVSVLCALKPCVGATLRFMEGKDGFLTGRQAFGVVKRLGQVGAIRGKAVKQVRFQIAATEGCVLKGKKGVEHEPSPQN